MNKSYPTRNGLPGENTHAHRNNFAKMNVSTERESPNTNVTVGVGLPTGSMWCDFAVQIPHKGREECMHHASDDHANELSSA